MDVAKEFRGVDYRIQLQIRRSALIATAKVYGMTPEAYADQLDAEAAAARALEPTPMQILGAFYRQLNDALVDMAEQFSKGWNEAGRR